MSTNRPAKVFASLLAYRSVAFHGETEGVEPGMASGANRIRAMLRKHVAQRSIRFGFVLRQLGNHGGRRRNHLAQNPPHHPIAALHRAGSQTGRTLGQEHGHRQQTATVVLARIVNPNPRIGIYGRVRKRVRRARRFGRPGRGAGFAAAGLNSGISLMP